MKIVRRQGGLLPGLLVVVLAWASIGASSCGSTSSSNDGGGSSKPGSSKKAALNRNTRRYMDRVAACRTEAGILRLQIQIGKLSDIQLADQATKARDLCDNIRTELATMPHDDFDDQAATGFYAVDRIKSGLNALLAYVDSPAPSKVIEARNKLNEGNRAAVQTYRQINRRRAVFGLGKYTP